jgi:hypothetical protein
MTVMSRKVDMITTKCDRCGFESASLVVEQPPEELRNRYAKRVAAWVEWKEDRPSAAEVVALRSLVSRLANVSLQELKHQAEDSQVWDLGVMWISQAIDLRERGKGLGLTIDFKIVPDEPKVM